MTRLVVGRHPCALVRRVRYDGFEMGPLFGLPSNNYGAETLLFVFSAAFLMLPLAALIAASLFDGLMRRRHGLGHLAPAPLSLRRYNRMCPQRDGNESRSPKMVYVSVNAQL